MAHINSIALGKASGKLGNVVFQSYNGMVIARQKNDTVTGMPSDAQVITRTKAYNAARIGQYFGGFLDYWYGYSKGQISTFNSFFKYILPLMENIRALHGFAAATQLNGHVVGKDKFLTNFDLDFSVIGGTDSQLIYYFDSLTPEYQEDLQLQVFVWDNLSGQCQLGYFAITEAEYIARQKTIIFEGFVAKYASCFAFHSQSKSASAIFTKSC